jgi:hypothetical protein
VAASPATPATASGGQTAPQQTAVAAAPATTADSVSPASPLEMPVTSSSAQPRFVNDLALAQAPLSPGGRLDVEHETSGAGVATNGSARLATRVTPQPALAAFASPTAVSTSLLASTDRAVSRTGLGGAHPTAPDLRTGLAGSAGASGGGGFAPSFFLVLLALVALAQLMYERLRLPSFTWRPVAFVSLQERPG